MKKVLMFSLCVAFFVSCQNTTSLHFDFEEQGNGKPTVILESGLGEDYNSWDNVMSELSSNLRIVRYNRLGIGNSSSTDKSRTLENLTSELNQFLSENDIEGPFILVGHSYGGYLVRSFQNQFPSDVIGLVLVDPSHEYGFERYYATKTKEEADSLKKELDKYFLTTPKYVQNEFKEFINSSLKMRKIKMPTNIPITLITSFKGMETETDIQRKENLLNDWKEDAHQMKIIKTIKSGHHVQIEEPELVVNEILNMIGNLKAN